MRRLWLVVSAAILVLFGALAWPAAPSHAQGAFLWNFRPNDTAGFQGQPSNGATNAVTPVAGSQFPYPTGGGIKIDYTGSRGFNTSVGTVSLPAFDWNSVVTIAADIYVPKEVTIGRLGLGIAVDGPPTNTLDVPVHLMATRGGWNKLSWPVHPGQLSGHHTLSFVLDTDDPMPAPLVIGNLRAVQPEIAVDASNTLGPIDKATLWGNNMAYYYPPSFLTDPNVSQLVKDAGFSFFRIPGGLNSDVYHWNGNGVRKPDGSIDPSARNADGTWRIDYSGWAPGFEVKGEGIAGDPVATNQPNFSQLNAYDHTPPVDVTQIAHWVTGLGAGAQLMVDVNVGSASALQATGPNNTLQASDVATGAREAAEWVKYYNKKLGLHVKYWEVGNELNAYGAEMGSHIRDSSPQGWHWITASDYATIFRAYASAMKAVDPAIKIAGPVGYVNAPADVNGGNMLQSFLQQAGDVVDVVDLHFYDSGLTEAQYLAVPSNLETQVAQVRAWIQQYAPTRASQIGVGVSEWGDYNNQYPIGDGLFAADLMGQMAKSQLAYGNAWDIGNMIPDNGSPAPRFGFDPASQNSGGWQTAPANGASNAISWTGDAQFARPNSRSMVVDYSGSTGANAALTRPLVAGHGALGLIQAGPGIDWTGVDEIRADVFVPQTKGDDAVSFWLRIQNADGTVDDSNRNQPQSTIWGQWNRLIFPVDAAKLSHAAAIDIVMQSPVALGSPLYFGEIETQKTLHQPNGRYWAAYMYHHYFGNTLLAASIGDVSRDGLAAYASRAADGSLWLMVVNKDPVSDITSPVVIEKSGIAPQAEAYTWSAAQYTWDPTQALATRDDPPSMRVVGSGPQFSYTFPKYSITALHLYPR